MNTNIPVSKDENTQSPIPSEWRSTISSIVDAFMEGDFQLKRGVKRVRPISAETAMQMADNVEEYGAKLISLPELAWQTSACQWMCGYWDVLVDLFTTEGASDLVLALRVFEDKVSYVFEIQTIYVP